MGGVLADLTWTIGGFYYVGRLKAQPHAHLKGPRAQRLKTSCGMLRGETKGGENHVRAGSGDHWVCGMAAEGMGVHAGCRKDNKF